tara:strand:- start:47 stop:964 length:918 start_codon:yes stop_codon:yes gene_type:complete
MAVITSDEPYYSSWSAPGPPKNAYEQAAQGMMQAGIGSLSGNQYDGPASMMTTSPGGNNYYHPNFNTVSSNLTNYLRIKNGDVSNVQYGISDFVNPNTGNAMSLSTAFGPNSVYARHVYPDGSGYEEQGGNTYPIQLKGPQTWRINPGNNKGIQAALNNKYRLMNASDVRQMDINRATREYNESMLPKELQPDYYTEGPAGMDESLIPEYTNDFELDMFLEGLTPEDLGSVPTLMAELSDPQINFMNSPMGTPDFFSSYQDYKDMVDSYEKKPFLGFGGQEPATDPEVIEYIKERYGTLPWSTVI